MIAEHMANGLLAGSYFIVLALGLSLIFGLGGVVNLAHGAFYALGAYFAYEAQRLFGFFPAMVISPVAVALIGIANGVALVLLLRALLASEVQDGRSLLIAALQVWLTNVITFGLAFWLGLGTHVLFGEWWLRRTPDLHG